MTTFLHLEVFDRFLRDSELFDSSDLVGHISHMALLYPAVGIFLSNCGIDRKLVLRQTESWFEILDLFTSHDLKFLLEADL